MKRVIAVAILVGFCVSSLHAQEKVHLEDLEMSLDIPANWFQVPAESELAQKHVGARLFASDDQEGQCVLFVSRSPVMGRTMEYLIGSTVHYVYNKMFGFVKKEDDLAIGGQDGYYLLYEGGYLKPDVPPKQYFRAMVINDEFVYTYYALAESESFKMHEGTLFSIVKSSQWETSSPRAEEKE